MRGRLPAKMQRLMSIASGLSKITQSEAGTINLPAPTLGMNTRDGVFSLDQREARSIRNMLAERGRLKIRKGHAEHQTVSGVSSIGTMFVHEGVSADVMLAAAGGEIYNVTSTPSALTSASYSSDVWSIVQFNDTSIAVNGADTPWSFDGSTVNASGLSGSGLTIANLRTVNVAGVRLWFTEVDSADVWYGAVNAVTGTLTKFQLSQETKGGYCVGIYAFRNYTVFIMSTGEVVAYQGDPGDDFSQVGTYDSPRPVGYDPGFDVAGEPVIMTVGGPLPFEAIAAGVAFDTVGLNTWGKIAPSWSDDFVEYGSNSGWNTLFATGLAIMNIQTSTTTSKQWVYNTRTKTWSYFDDLDGYQFVEMDGTIYFGDKDSNTIWKYSTGQDDGSAIVATIRSGFTYPFSAKVNGEYHAARLNVSATGNVTGQVQIDNDYQELGVSVPEEAIAASGSGPWDGPWDGAWGTSGQPILKWSGIGGFGAAVAYVAQFNSNADDLEFFGVDLLASPCGPIG